MTTTRDRSYCNRVSRGDIITFTAPTATLLHTRGNTFEEDLALGHRLTIGQTYTGTVLNESNAGFRGIEMSVRLSSGQTVTGISTGCIVA